MKFLFLFFCSFSIFAQTKGVVVDILGNPIPYVNNWVVGENVGTTSEEDGTFIINSTKDKILIFSAVGFETKRTTLNDDQRIMLKSKIFELDAVVISKIKNTKEYETTDSKIDFTYQNRSQFHGCWVENFQVKMILNTSRVYYFIPILKLKTVCLEHGFLGLETTDFQMKMFCQKKL